MGYEDVRQGDEVDVFGRSPLEDTRRKARKYGAVGRAIRAVKPARR